MKKVFCAILYVILFLGIVSIGNAENTGKSGRFSYTIKGNGTATITKYDWSMFTGDIYVPNLIDGYTVTSIGDEAFSCATFPTDTNQIVVHLPDTITSIGNKAFMHSGISAINIPLSVQIIGTGAFAGC